MVGTHRTTMGGIATVVRGYRDAGLFERYDCAYVVTHVDGSALRKGAVALGAWLRFLVLLVTRPQPLVHIHLSSRASFWRKSVICLLSILARRPYILHMHGSEFMKFYDVESGATSRRFVRYLFKRAALSLALSEQWRDNILHICPHAAVEVLPNAVAVPPVQETPAGADAPLGILFLGRLGRRKGTYDLVDAFARAVKQLPSARLICAGDGEVDAVQAHAAALGIADVVSCPGWLDVAGTAAQLDRAAVFALPSHAEGVPMALLEAMAKGLAVVTTPVGGIPQVISDGENGLLVEPGDVEALGGALTRLLSDAGLRRRLGESARRTVEERFSIGATIERLGAIYRSFGILPRPNT